MQTNELTPVEHWSQAARNWVSTPARHIICQECGARYPAMDWDEVLPGEPFLQCPCGEQFHITANRDRW